MYVLDDEISSGSFGDVLELFVSSSWKVYAAKIVKTKSLPEIEASLLRELVHVSICSVEIIMPRLLYHATIRTSPQTTSNDNYRYPTVDDD